MLCTNLSRKLPVVTMQFRIIISHMLFPSCTCSTKCWNLTVTSRVCIQEKKLDGHLLQDLHMILGTKEPIIYLKSKWELNWLVLLRKRVSWRKCISEISSLCWKTRTWQFWTKPNILNKWSRWWQEQYWLPMWPNISRTWRNSRLCIMVVNSLILLTQTDMYKYFDLVCFGASFPRMWHWKSMFRVRGVYQLGILAHIWIQQPDKVGTEERSWGHWDASLQGQKSILWRTSWFHK